MFSEIKASLFDQLGSSVSWILFDNYYDDDIDYLQKLTKILQKEAPKEVHTEVLTQRLNNLLKTRIGSMAPEIALPDANGNVQKLSDLRGKYVLVDFWASWCGPCRKENPFVLKAYKKYKAKGLEIFGVSLDEKKDKWTNAIQKDQLTWINVSDLKGWGSVAAKTYNVESVPRNFLIDKDGKIIAKNLRGDALEQKLKEILK